MPRFNLNEQYILKPRKLHQDPSVSSRIGNFNMEEGRHFGEESSNGSMAGKAYKVSGMHGLSGYVGLNYRKLLVNAS